MDRLSAFHLADDLSGVAVGYGRIHLNEVVFQKGRTIGTGKRQGEETGSFLHCRADGVGGDEGEIGRADDDIFFAEDVGHVFDDVAFLYELGIEDCGF